MIDYQAIVDGIRNVLTFSETSAPGTLHQLAEQYAGACEELNGRLRSCSFALRQGNITEAVRLAEMEPNLLDVYTILDFPERDEWVEAVSTLALAVPPPLPVEYARELNDAYRAQNVLEPHLKRFRLAVLARASLSERLTLLREIARVEPQNIAWQRDQESLERVRLEELDSEIRDAIQTNHLTTLHTLRDELTQHWIVPPPSHLLEQVELVLRSNRLQLVTEEMRRCGGQLVQAHLEFDHGKSLVIYEKLQRLQSQYKFPVPDDVVQATRGAVEWLQEENRRKKNRLAYRAAHDAVIKALKSDTMPAELRRMAYHLDIAARDAEATVPEELARAVANEITMWELQRRRRTRLVTLVVIVTCLAVIGLVSLFVYSYSQFRKTREIIATLERLKEEASPPAIRGYLAGRETDLAASNSEQVAALLASLREIVASDDRRIERLDAKCRQFSDLLDGDGINSPAMYARLEGQLKDVERLTETEDDRRTLETLRGRFLQKSRDYVAGQDENLNAKIQEVQLQITAINDHRELPNAEVLDRYVKLLRELEATGNTYPNASAITRERCRNMINLLREQINRLESNETEP
ncbi:MAG: hypothetical protein FWH27_04105 [Planctomycetaceae bacterium]|nr:hypothetical protein [Planctomycetaceae bacterium]